MDTICIPFCNDTQRVGDERCYGTYGSNMKWYVRARLQMTKLNVTQEAVAEALGVTRGAVGHWLSGRREPTLQQLETIAERIGCTRAELLDDDERAAYDLKLAMAAVRDPEPGTFVPYPDDEPQQAPAALLAEPAALKYGGARPKRARAGTYEVPRLDVRASMGNGIAIRDVVEILELVQINVEALCHERGVSITSPANLRILTGYGPSMRPTFDHLDQLLVDIGVTDIRVDDVYCLENDDELFIKRIQRVPGKKDTYMMISDNKAFENFEISDPIRSGFKVLARVIAALNLNKV